MVSAVFAVSLFAGMAVGDDEDGPVKWAVLVYLLADNNLDELTEEDLDELMAVGSGDDVKVLALVDRLEDVAHLYRVEFKELVELEDCGELNGIELNMGDPATLRTFVEYANASYSPEHMLLFFWNHGSGVSGVGIDDTVPDQPGVSDWLTHHELIEALEDIHVDILAMDECSVGQMETIYEYAVQGMSVDYVVASESYIGWRGFSYDKILERLTDDPDMGARELSLVIAEEFTNLFTRPPYKCEILTTQSVFEMSKVRVLGERMLDLADLLAEDIDVYRTAVAAARAGSQMPWGANSAGRIDMPSFVEGLMTSGQQKAGPLIAACEAVLAAYSDVLVGMGVSKNTELYNYKGMGILFPSSYSMYTVANAGSYEKYMAFEFPNEGWWAFLEAYWAVV